MPGMNTTTTSSEPCIAMPSMPNCTDYTYPTSNATADITSLCNAMPFMTGCSISNICATGGSSSLALQSGGYCNPISLLADTCKSDTGMSKMSGCKSYNSMCNMTAGSVVSACTKYPPVPGLPTTMAVNAAVKSICTEMSMSGCEKCSWAGNVTFANCDLLVRPCVGRVPLVSAISNLTSLPSSKSKSVYSSLCTQMPTMSQCSAFPGMCSSGALGQTGLCTTQSDSSSDAVNMLMYFHAGIRDYFLFYQWVPKSELVRELGRFGLGRFNSAFFMHATRHRRVFWVSCCRLFHCRHQRRTLHLSVSTSTSVDQNCPQLILQSPQ